MNEKLNGTFLLQVFTIIGLSGKIDLSCVPTLKMRYLCSYFKNEVFVFLIQK